MNARDKIMKAADDLFGKVGFDAATTREIAERSGVNKALIHYHFKSKESLFETLLDRYYNRLAASLEKSLLGEEGPLKDRMLALVDAYIDFLAANRNFSRIVQREAAGGKHMERVRSHMVPLFELGTKLLHGAYPQTVAGDLAAAQLLISFYGMIISYFTYQGLLKHLLDADPLSKKSLEVRKQHLRRMVEISLEALEKNGRKKG
jgi:TetR/AcrR family transcriptional regulator